MSLPSMSLPSIDDRIDWYIERGEQNPSGTHWGWDVPNWGKPTVAIDFHHTITRECCACPGGDPNFDDTNANGPPHENVQESLTRLQKIFKLLIFTGSGAFWNAEQCATIVDYLHEHNIPFDAIRFDKPPATYIIDDRALQFRGDWRETVREVERRSGHTF